jgi:hypothetical protein
MGEISKNVDVNAVLGEAKNLASELGNQAKEKVSKTVGKRWEESAMQLSGIADTLRQKGGELEGSMFAPVVNQAAAQIDRAAEFVMDADVDQVVRSTEGFARREPLLFVGGAFTLGLLVARFFKSASFGNSQQGDGEGIDGGEVQR